MADKKIAVFGIYPSLLQAEGGVDALVTGRFDHSDISVLAPDEQTTKDFAHEKHTKSPEGATAGAATGGAIGGTVGLLVGLGALAIPGLGPFIAAGPIMATLAGVGAGGAVGGLIGGLVGMGLPEYEARRYEGRVKDGGVLLSVHCSTAEEVQSAKEILEQTGAADIASSREKSSEPVAVPVRDRTH